MNDNTKKALHAFLAVADDFKLGELATEGMHPLTADLSELAQNDVEGALSALKDVDILALKKLREYAPQISELAESVREVLAGGRRVFLCGCGATGRLSLSLEVLGRQALLPAKYCDRVIGFMAGGDSALIKSIERFEDYPEYGVRQLKELGYVSGDLLIAITEGGETPFVIGAAEYAAETGSERPWFVYCNEDDVLSAAAERSRRVIQNNRIRKLNLSVGPMALSGSTRMQATTVQMAAVGFALFFGDNAEKWFEDLLDLVKKADYSKLSGFVDAESSIYKENNYITYRTRDHGITVLTDTTERSPTFSLVPFENVQDAASDPSLCYLCIDETADSAEAWHRLLQRSPRCIEWGDFQAVAGREYFMGFDISQRGCKLRTERVRPAKSYDLEVGSKDQGLFITLLDMKSVWEFGGSDLLQQHLLLKMLLNAHSTTVMGRLQRYEGNVMTWVKSSNNKLIDRAVRYVRELWLRDTQTVVEYEKAAAALFAERESLPITESIVIKTLERLKREGNRG